MIFFTGGPELGEVRAGFVAAAFGAPFAIVSGGISVLVMVAWQLGGIRLCENEESDTESSVRAVTQSC